MNTKILLYPTGYGKTKKGLEALDKNYPCLIVVPKLVLIENWKKEIIKWGYNLSHFSFTTYASLHKNIISYKHIIFDEGHHLTTRCLNIINKYKNNIDNIIILSATIPNKKLLEFNSYLSNIVIEKKDLKNAISEKKLPEPKIIKIKLKLDSSCSDQCIILNKNGKAKAIFSFKDLYKAKSFAKKNKNIKVEIPCTKKQKYLYIEEQIDYFKKLYYRYNKETFKNKWLSLCLERLKYLSSLKKPIINLLLDKYYTEKKILFCASIEEAKQYPNPITSEDSKNNTQILNDFNNNNINTITACNILNEGVNLTNCKIGILSNINSSEIIIIQKIGRLLRHPEPIIIIPYYENTREEELLEKDIYNI